MFKLFRRLMIVVFAVTVVMLLGTFPAFALSGHPVVFLATAASTFTTQTKILWVIGLVYAALQGVKKFLPITGIGAVIANVALSVGAVLVIVQPQDLWSTQTLIAVITAGAGAAGVHGTVRSFSNPTS
jgi:hypothetical protein